jgi:response regulator NasT
LAHKLREDLFGTRPAQKDHKVIDRTKGTMMQARGIGAQEAYGVLHKTAMDQGK